MKTFAGGPIPSFGTKLYSHLTSNREPMGWPNWDLLDLAYLPFSRRTWSYTKHIELYISNFMCICTVSDLCQGVQPGIGPLKRKLILLGSSFTGQVSDVRIITGTPPGFGIPLPSLRATFYFDTLIQEGSFQYGKSRNEVNSPFTHAI